MNQQLSKENNNVEEKTKLPDAVRISNGRCKFWPKCKNDNVCQYFHPAMPCL